jgi:hypothetical protein
MGYEEYKKSQDLSLHATTGPGNAFYALLMAAVRFADTDNLNTINQHWPEMYNELMTRINAPGGKLPGEK